MIIIGRFINDIPLNDYEFVLDEDGDTMEFNNEGEAKQFLRDHGCDDEYIDNCIIFFEECPVCHEYVPSDELKWSGNVLCCDSCAEELY